MRETELEELTLEDLADPVETGVDWDHAVSLLHERYVAARHLEPIFESLARSESESAEYQELYQEIEGEYDISQHRFKYGISALSQSGIVPSRRQDVSQSKRYNASIYTPEEWRSIEGKTSRAINGSL